jgi:squalene-associated FAD-dependent desaturase
MNRTVVVVGGGLAGIAAALGCADAGLDVTLLEAKPRLGGRTHSFRRGGLWVDNGQHIFLRCCTSYRRLLVRLGASELTTMQQRLDVPVRSGRRPGQVSLRRTAGPAPLHLGPSLARYRWLSPAERVRAVKGVLALRRVDRTDPAVDEETFGAWLSRHGQSRQAVAALWDLIGVATLNARADQASLALAATVFQIGLLERPDAADVGWSTGPLRRLHGDSAADALRAARVDVRLRVKVDGLEQADGGWTVRHGDQSTTAHAVVLACPPRAAEALLPDGAVQSGSGWSDALGAAPIVNLHLIFDRPALDEPFVAAVDSPLQWVFDRTQQAGLADGQYLAVSLSAADDIVGRPVAELQEWALPHLYDLLPRAAAARLKEFFVTREPSATFRPAAGSGRHRLPTQTELPGLCLAGAWTDTGWPDTMEGAVRSGEAATAAVVRHALAPQPVGMSA